MRFVLGPPPTDARFDPIAAGWTPLVSSSEIKAATAASALGLLGCLAAGCVCFRIAAPALETDPRLLIGLLFAPALLVPVHELVHALAYRVPLSSPDLLTGIWPQRGVWYVLYDAPLPRNRVLAMLVAPLLALSALPAAAIPLLPDALRGAGGYVVLTHAALCAGDLVTFFRMARTIPRDARVCNRGWTTCWSSAPDP